MKIALFTPVLLICSLARADVKTVRREVARIDARKLALKTSERTDLSTEGAQISVYCDTQKTPHKIVARIYGESGQLKETIYLQQNQLLFVFSVEERYQSPLGTTSPVKVASRTETRLYFDKGRLTEKRMGKKQLSLTATQKRTIEKQTRDSIRTYLSPAKE